MAVKRRKSSSRSRSRSKSRSSSSSSSSYGRRRRRTRGLSGVAPRRSAKKRNLQEGLKNGVMDIVAAGVGTFVAAKGVAMLDGVINKSGGKAMGFVSPAVAAVAGVVGAAMVDNRIVQSLAKGVAVGGAIKLAEKAMGKDNLLSGLDENDRALMLPGIGETGQADLPELPHYSENPDAPVTATGADYEYQMGRPNEVLSGNADFIAF